MTEIEKAGAELVEDHEERFSDVEDNPKLASKIEQAHSAMYAEAIERYPSDEAIDAAMERKLVRKLDRRILPLLGICYFFYVCLYTSNRTRDTICDHLREMLTTAVLLIVC